MSGKRSTPWDVLGVAPSATEKEIRRAYATQLKAIDVTADPEGFEWLRSAYEYALRASRFHEAKMARSRDEALSDPPGATMSENEPGKEDKSGQNAVVDATPAFSAMQALVEERNYSVIAWRALLNSPVLDPPEINARFEYELIDALCANELKTEYTLSASQAWCDLVESRYAWVADGLRFVSRFPDHVDLRDALVDMRKVRGKGVARTVRVDPAWRAPFLALVVMAAVVIGRWLSQL
jgi:hypothetical protein